MIILGKRFYKDHLKHQESNHYDFTKVQVSLEQKQNIYNIKNLPFRKNVFFLKKKRKKKKEKKSTFFYSIILPVLQLPTIDEKKVFFNMV